MFPWQILQENQCTTKYKQKDIIMEGQKNTEREKEREGKGKEREREKYII